MSLPEPYQGNEPYIFISYPHKDSAIVLPIINTLQQQGFRTWYDAGIEFGMPWDNDIAGHVRKCAVFIAMMSQNYLDSDNCCDELHFARECKKPSLLIYTQAVTLPDHIAMRYGRLQAIHHFGISENEFLQRILNASVLRSTKGTDPLPQAAYKPHFRAEIPLSTPQPAYIPHADPLPPTPAMQERFPTVPARYHINSFIGRGMSSDVYSATDLQLNREVALKIYSRYYIPDIALLHMPEIVETLAENPHSNLPLLYGMESLPTGNPMVITERIHGKTLRKLRDEAKSTFLDKANCLLQMCGALMFLHQLGYVYGDLSPDNVMVDGIQLYLVDFSSLRPIGTVSADRTVIGVDPFDFQSPEFLDHRPLTPASDVYSMGKMMHYLLTHDNLPIDDLPLTAYRDLLEMISFATAKDPEIRPSMQQLQMDLMELFRHNTHHEIIRTDLSHRR